ncbi:MAG: gamma carbonic anhydrase family protein [Bdellovibrionaceae bacterium]|nr:gamma carbonic anhydrase family protein [Pseudobdellovibrionaceae bacterium]MDW8189392.1 gamma carbonic anhydrase family protein [Pseudobdellovibrionaceae bacterium]
MAIIRSVCGHTPCIAPSAFVAENATIVGNVIIGEQSSIWYHAVLRGDVNRITIGDRSNIQDGCIVHGTYQTHETVVGNHVTVGHGAILHGCFIGSGCLIGMGSIVMDGVELGEYCLVAAGSLLTEGKKFPSKTLIVGRPASVKRFLTNDEIEMLHQSSQNYLMYMQWYQHRV